MFCGAVARRMSNEQLGQRFYHESSDDHHVAGERPGEAGGQPIGVHLFRRLRTQLGVSRREDRFGSRSPWTGEPTNPLHGAIHRDRIKQQASVHEGSGAFCRDSPGIAACFPPASADESYICLPTFLSKGKPPWGTGVLPERHRRPERSCRRIGRPSQ